jgi:hypothetical protein
MWSVKTYAFLVFSIANIFVAYARNASTYARVTKHTKNRIMPAQKINTRKPSPKIKIPLKRLLTWVMLYTNKKNILKQHSSLTSSAKKQPIKNCSQRPIII